jgi:hypothetical protein
MPVIANGTLYVHIARIHIVESEAQGDDPPSRRIDRIDQILGSHIVWPFKPDFIGWQHKRQQGNVKSAVWLGADSAYINDCDNLEDLHIKVQREAFDNGRGGDTVFELSMPEGSAKQSVLAFDKNQDRGVELRMSEGNASATRLTVDRKSTSGGGLQVVSDSNGCSIGLACVDEGGSLSLVCQKESGEASTRIEFESENKSILDLRAGEEKVIKFTEPQFDNGRDGDTQFMVRAPSGAAAVTLSLDKNQQRGFEAGAGESSSWISLDRKTTASPGFLASSNDSESSASVSGPNESTSARMLAKEDAAQIDLGTANASLEAKAEQQARLTLDSPSPEVLLSGSGGSTRVTTVNGKEIRMREISFMGPDGRTRMKAWFLASEPESEQPDSNAHDGHHLLHNDDGHQGQHMEHGNHHMQHYVDPDHDPDDNPPGPGPGPGPGPDPHHGGHHEDHHVDENYGPGPHHADLHHNQGGS